MLDGRIDHIDLGRAGDRLFATVAAFGFDAEISDRMANGQVPFSGTIGYLYETLRHTGRYRPPRVCLRGDFGEIDQEVLQVSTANTRSYGGGMQIAPAADPLILDMLTADKELRIWITLGAGWLGGLRRLECINYDIGGPMVEQCI